MIATNKFPRNVTVSEINKKYSHMARNDSGKIHKRTPRQSLKIKCLKISIENQKTTILPNFMQIYPTIFELSTLPQLFRIYTLTNAGLN